MTLEEAVAKYNEAFSTCIEALVNASDEEFVGNRPTLEDIGKAVANVRAAVRNVALAAARQPYTCLAEIERLFSEGGTG